MTSTLRAETEQANEASPGHRRRHSGRNLLWLLQARLGRERAVIHAGGVPMFDGYDPDPLIDAPELPSG